MTKAQETIRARRRHPIRRPAAEVLVSAAMESQALGTFTTALLTGGCDLVSADTARTLEQCEVLERAVLALLQARAGTPEAGRPLTAADFRV